MTRIHPHVYIQHNVLMYICIDLDIYRMYIYTQQKLSLIACLNNLGGKQVIKMKRWQKSTLCIYDFFFCVIKHIRLLYTNEEVKIWSEWKAHIIFIQSKKRVWELFFQ